MTPDALAALHGVCFVSPRPWSAVEFQELLQSPGVFLETRPKGFVLGRVIADEAELLTLAVDPAARRAGLGTALVKDFVATARAHGATRAFLEVAATNQAARALYQAQGFAQAGLRRGYYRNADGSATDALILDRTLANPTS